MGGWQSWSMWKPDTSDGRKKLDGRGNGTGGPTPPWNRMYVSLRCVLTRMQ